jgi:periplasmic divalent cation tolerance protein
MLNSQTRALVILCTCPDEDTAARLARGLIETRLAACVNILPGVRSIYRWQGEVSDDAEALLLIKTVPSRFGDLESWVCEHHPYEVPEVLALPAEKGSEEYLSWIEACTGE